MSNPFPIERTVKPLSSFREVKPGSFIFERPNTIPADWCEEMIRRCEANPEQQNEGRIGQVQGLDTGIKRTMDLVVSGREDWKDIDEVFFQQDLCFLVPTCLTQSIEQLDPAPVQFELLRC